MTTSLVFGKYWLTNDTAQYRAIFVPKIYLMYNLFISNTTGYLPLKHRLSVTSELSIFYPEYSSNPLRLDQEYPF